MKTLKIDFIYRWKRSFRKTFMRKHFVLRKLLFLFIWFRKFGHLHHPSQERCMHDRWVSHRLLQQKYWKRKIKNHCHTYKIRCVWFDLKEQYQRILTDLSFKSKCRFYKEHRDTLLNIIRIAYGIKDKQIKKINKALEIKKADIRLKTDRDFTTKSNNRKRGGTYWTIENIKDCTDFLNSYNN